jgi:hypothetical protein
MMPMPSEIALMRWARRANNRNWDRQPGRIAGTNPLEAGAPMRSLKPSDRRTIMASLLALSLAGPAFADSGRSRDFVAEIYRVAGGPSGDGSDGEAIFADEANRKRFLSHGLRAAIDAMDWRTPKGDAPDLDFDPISSGNDPNFHDVRITVESEQAARAVVIADFVSHQDKVRTVLRYLQVRENDGWKIDDIIASGKNEWRVRKLIRGTAGK